KPNRRRVEPHFITGLHPPQQRRVVDGRPRFPAFHQPHLEPLDFLPLLQHLFHPPQLPTDHPFTPPKAEKFGERVCRKEQKYVRRPKTAKGSQKAPHSRSV